MKTTPAPQRAPSQLCGPTMDSLSQQYWTSRAWEYHENELHSVRQSAGKWKTTVSSISSGAAILTVLTARDDIFNLNDTAWFSLEFLSLQNLVLALIFVALATAVKSLYLVSRAELGPLAPLVASPDQYCAFVRREPILAASYIRRSQLYALGSLVSFLAALLLIGGGPTAQPSPPSVIGSTDTLETVCGRLQSNEVGHLFVIPDNGTPIALQHSPSPTIVETCG